LEIKGSPSGLEELHRFVLETGTNDARNPTEVLELQMLVVDRADRAIFVVRNIHRAQSLKYYVIHSVPFVPPLICFEWFNCGELQEITSFAGSRVPNS